MLELLDVARAEEYRIATGVGGVAAVAEPFAGGMMCRDVPGSWSNAVYGAGLDGPVTQDDVGRMVQFYLGASIEPRMELCTFAHPSLVAEVARAGFVVRAFESVFFRPLERGESFAPLYAAPDGLVIEVVDPRDEAMVDTYARVAAAGFAPPGQALPEDVLAVSRRVAHHPRVVAIVARLDGEVVGAGGLEMTDDVAALFGLSVIPSARRRGVQQAMIAWRLRRAAERGVTLATISSRPGVATERNVRRMGFQVAYTRAAIVRPGPGLAPVIE